ncbi:hypothetical protein [Actinoplanes sp. GCM10030250]|uniref:hypothetical protein n=1 Tax=Actinoplanes sp. GCM10030250 TaxID=3273376 RepID=UPI0036218495
MPGRALHAEIEAVRALVADGLAEVSAAAGDLEQFWIRSACLRLAAVDAALVEAAGRITVSVQVAVGTVVSFGVVSGVAALGQVAGLGSGAVVVLAGVVLGVLVGTAPMVGHRVRVAVGRRRLARAGRVGGAEPVGAGDAHIGLLVVPESLERARIRLVSATLREVGSGSWRVPQLRLAARTDPVRRLAHADLLLCQAIDCLERYLDDLAKGWP